MGQHCYKRSPLVSIVKRMVVTYSVTQACGILDRRSVLEEGAESDALSGDSRCKKVIISNPSRLDRIIRSSKFIHQVIIYLQNFRYVKNVKLHNTFRNMPQPRTLS